MGLLKKKVINILSDGSIIFSYENSFKKSNYFSFKEKDFKSFPLYKKTQNKIIKDNENNFKYLNKFFKYN